MARALKQAGSTPKEGGQYVNVLCCFFGFSVVKQARLFVPILTVHSEDRTPLNDYGILPYKHQLVLCCERILHY